MDFTDEKSAAKKLKRRKGMELGLRAIRAHFILLRLLCLLAAFFHSV
jgi:hypothetical protein